MIFRIPFTRASNERLKQKSKLLAPYVRRKNKKLEIYLKSVDAPFTGEEYKGLVLRYGLSIFILSCITTTTLFFFLNVKSFFIMGLGLALLLSIFVSGTQMAYPRLFASRRQRNIERNLIPALEDMLVQLNSGVPLFSIMVNISSSDYGELSAEFKKAVRKINTGEPETDVFDEMGKKNTSPFFRRTIWQLSNGMKAGSDISIVVKESIRSLNEEQALQIQTYGNKLNPLIMFYMLISVILPALSITFLTIISSLVGLARNTTIALFLGLFVMVTIIQITFIGIMRSLRPSLL